MPNMRLQPTALHAAVAARRSPLPRGVGADGWPRLLAVRVCAVVLRHRPNCGPHGALGLAVDDLHRRDGALAHERHGHWMVADAVARDTAGRMGGVEEERGGHPMIRLARRSSLLVSISLFISAMTGHAECAWMLWVRGPWIEGYWQI